MNDNGRLLPHFCRDIALEKPDQRPLEIEFRM
ncbi:hypothetical protein J2X72_002192 [Phyllobacterium sp. 1468]|nr:hypothetical protein [Phyllobacterium sp. 1468]